MEEKEKHITDKYITISMEEYKELLIIKGKYEELKAQQLVTMPMIPQTLNPYYTTEPIDIPAYKITCDCSKEAEQ